ncbi:MAG: radical SAM protein [Spirochaetales bacterium]|nr:radical SAM protein [Spirochaetales bacterium]
MAAAEIMAKSIIRKFSRTESWFLGQYSMNLYRGCAHNCIYCDGRAEKYYVEGDFGKDISVKVNAAEILDRELDPSRRRKPLPKGFVVLGGGVSDSYQPLELQYEITKKVLQVIRKYNYPVHILTKSTLVERDIGLITQINTNTQAIVSMSFSSVDPALSAFLEPGVPPPEQRLRVLRQIKQAGIPVGMFLMPVVPGLSDTAKKIEESVSAARDAGIDFIIFGGMTLKEGRQKEYFLERLIKNHPEIADNYPVIYRGDKYGAAIGGYYKKINDRFFTAARKYNMPVRIPLEFWKDQITMHDRIIVLLEHIDSILSLRKDKSPYGYAAYALSKREDLSELISSDKLKDIQGFSKEVKDIILEIAETGTSSLYKKLLSGSDTKQTDEEELF